MVQERGNLHPSLAVFQRGLETLNLRVYDAGSKSPADGSS
jgi:hypothetical protein